MGATLPDPPPVALEGGLDRCAPAPAEPCFFAAAERGGCSGPGLAVARQAVRPQLGTERDQGREVGDGLDRAGLGHADEAVRVEVVAEQKRGVLVTRREQPRSPVVQQVALVDRLEPERIPLLAERREDRLQLAVGFRPQRFGPEPALPGRFQRDRLPQVESYSQPASSFVQ